MSYPARAEGLGKYDKGISLKVTVMVRLEFELVYFETAFQTLHNGNSLRNFWLVCYFSYRRTETIYIIPNV